MPNTFAPKAIEVVMKDRVATLRMNYAGSAADVKEWHALVDMMDADALAEFKEHYETMDKIPAVVDGISEQEGLVPDLEG